jgi:hypothetical protein
LYKLSDSFFSTNPQFLTTNANSISGQVPIYEPSNMRYATPPIWDEAYPNQQEFYSNSTDGEVKVNSEEIGEIPESPDVNIETTSAVERRLESESD